MSEPSFDIAFYGILQPGKDKDAVIQNMARLFKTTPDKVRPFFAGGRKVIKSAVDELTAEKYRAALENIGLVIKLESGETEQAGAAENTDTISVAPVGADVLENPPVVEPQPIGDISDITMAEAGADVLENPPVVEPQPIGDISDITMAEVGADVLENPPVVEAQPIGDISNITMAEAGADIIDNPKPAAQSPAPDSGDRSIKDNNS
ncbi:MAG: hypothetical protein JSW45_11200 [Thiotrichales bacterium]|nr:MAG: hypothetical protein JSW45_11200 [Thiotrichales bacterium]